MTRRHYSRHIRRALHKTSPLWRKYRRDKTVLSTTLPMLNRLKTVNRLFLSKSAQRKLELINKSNLGAFTVSSTNVLQPNLALGHLGLQVLVM